MVCLDFRCMGLATVISDPFPNSPLSPPVYTALSKDGANFVYTLLQLPAIFGLDKVCLQYLSAFWPSFRRSFCRQSLSAGLVCILANFRRIFCRQGLSAEFVCQGFLCRQTLSAETADKVCLQGLSAFWLRFRRIFYRQSLSA